MSAARVVCWMNREEWLQVYQQLYNFDDPAEQRKGVDRVAAWTSRSGAKLPLAVESTAYLVSAHLGLAEHGAESNGQGRLMLAMGLVRFVNGMVDKVQKGMFARTVHSIAEEIGLPDWLVDLRHNATHSSLPSIETLHCGLRVSLTWLQDEYWEAQLGMHKTSTEKLSQLLSYYVDKALSQVLRRKKKAKFRSSQEMTALATEIKNLVTVNNLWSVLVSFLSQEGMLVPSSEQLKKLNLDWPIEAFPSVASIPSIPIEIVYMWKVLLETLDNASSGFIPSLSADFLDYLSDASHGKTSRSLLCCAAWVHYWLLVASNKRHDELVSTQSFPWVSLLEISLARPTSFSLAFIPLILENMPEIGVDLKQRIEHLALLYIKPPVLDVKDLCESYECESDYDIEKWISNKKNSKAEKENNEAMLQQSNSSKFKSWSVCQGSTQWNLLPFGEVLGTKDMSPDNLVLGQSIAQLQPLPNSVDVVGHSEHQDVGNQCTRDDSVSGFHDEEMFSDYHGDAEDSCLGLTDCELTQQNYSDDNRDYQNIVTNDKPDDCSDAVTRQGSISSKICIF